MGSHICNGGSDNTLPLEMSCFRQFHYSVTITSTGIYLICPNKTVQFLLTDESRRPQQGSYYTTTAAESEVSALTGKESMTESQDLRCSSLMKTGKKACSRLGVCLVGI